ncbi:MAG: dodecin domain-containing protein [Pseudomonadota bacterium]
MSVDQTVWHILTVTGFSSVSFDEAVKNAIAGAKANHPKEFERFVSFEVKSMQGDIVDTDPPVKFSVTVAINAIHAEHNHGHNHDDGHNHDHGH